MSRTGPRTPSELLELGLSFWRSKALLSAVELGVFLELSRAPRTGRELVAALGLNGRGAIDLFDALVALGVLTRVDGVYANAATAEEFLVPGKPSYVGGALELAGSRLYPVWGALTEALRSGSAQNEARDEEDYYGNLVRDRERLSVFLRAMSGLSLASSRAIAERFPWARYRTFADIGGARGELAIRLCERHPHLSGVTFDLPAVEPHFAENVASFGLASRVGFVAGDFFHDPLPNADVIVMGHVLHNWDLEKKTVLVKKAYEALPPAGALVVYEALIDDERRENAFGMLMSLNMLLVTSGGFVFTGEECSAWMRDAGFRETRVAHLDGPDSMVIGIKAPA
jgi:hypothetical protein